MNFAQTLFIGYPSPKNIVLLDFDIKNLSGKIRAKITKLRKGSKITFACITKPVYDSMMGVWNSVKVNQQSGTFICTDSTHGTFKVSSIKAAS